MPDGGHRGRARPPGRHAGGGRRLRALPRLRRRRLRDRHDAVRRRRHDRLTTEHNQRRTTHGRQPSPPRPSRRPSSTRSQFGADEPTRSSARRRSRSSTSTRSTSPSSRRSSRTSTASSSRARTSARSRPSATSIDLVVEPRGMSREVVVTGVGAVTPLGVGARTLHERWRAGESASRTARARATEFEPDRVPLAQGGAPRRPLHAVRAGRRATRRWPRPAGTASCPYDADADRLRHRHRHRRHRHARAQPRRAARPGPDEASRRSPCR